MHKSPVIWLTGMSGSGKSTLANCLQSNLKTKGYKGIIIDGDSVRDLDKKKLGFGIDDVLLNNTRIALLSEEKRREYDFILIPVISPYESVRKKIRKILEPNLHLIYLKTDIDIFKERDTKGLYAASDRGELKTLIGYSDVNPYNEPVTPELTVLTSSDKSISCSLSSILNYLDNKVFF